MAGLNRRNTSRTGYRHLSISDLLNPALSISDFSSSAPLSTPSIDPPSISREYNNNRGSGGRSVAAYSIRTTKCSDCNRAFSSGDDLTTRRVLSHPDPFTCHICNSSFYDRENLNKHVRWIRSTPWEYHVSNLIIYYYRYGASTRIADLSGAIYAVRGLGSLMASNGICGRYVRCIIRFISSTILTVLNRLCVYFFFQVRCKK